MIIRTVWDTQTGEASAHVDLPTGTAGEVFPDVLCGVQGLRKAVFEAFKDEDKNTAKMFMEACADACLGELPQERADFFKDLLKEEAKMMTKRKAPADSHVCGSRAFEGLGNVSKSYGQILAQRERKSKMMSFFGFEMPSGKDLLIFAVALLVAVGMLLLIGQVEILTGVAG